MDDDLLADDGQYKDDGLDDLDIDAEAALLGLSDEEIDDQRSPNDDQELEYVDEDGNPVTIGENNADLYEVANVEAEKVSSQADEDVLELDLDAELESFNQETSDLLRESPTPVKSYKDRQRKENLISLTSRKEQERPAVRRKESHYSPERDQDKLNKDVSFGKSNKEVSFGKPNKEVTFSNQNRVLQIDSRDSSYNDDDLEFDEESEDENADDHRERFKSERSNIITLTPAKRRADIPDTLESVLCVEETARVQAYLEDQQRKKRNKIHRPHGRQKPSFSRPNRNFPPPPQEQQPPQFSGANSSVTQTASAPRRKILINPHFTGVRLPLPSESVPPVVETHLPPAMPPTTYDNQNFPPPVYSHHEPVQPISMAPPPIYTAPPPTVQYKPPEYPPPPTPQPIQQMPPPTWQQPPDMNIQSYSVPPPVMNYGDPGPQPPNYNNYNQNYQNVNYQNPPMPMPPQTVNYNQPPPQVHMFNQPFTSQPFNPEPSNMQHPHYSHAPNQVRMQQINMQPQPYQETPVISQPQMNVQSQKPRYSQNNQRFSRPPEKRMSNLNIKHVPVKQARLEHPPKKSNIHVNNSNIREIPLVDTLPSSRKNSANKTVPIVEDEDEKTKELRMKIEEQKLLREQILKRKEERRRQMAAQRLFELKKRQAEQNKNTVTIVPKATNQSNVTKTLTAVKPVLKPSVKERIGLPLNKNVPAAKKKIIVVRKKAPQNVANAANNSKPPVIAGQRIKLPISSQQNNKQPVKLPTTEPNSMGKQASQNKPMEVPVSVASAKTVENKPPMNTGTQNKRPAVSTKKVALTSQAQRGKNARFGNRQNFQRPPFSPMQRMQRPRVPGPRGSQFSPPSLPFREPRMPFHNHGPPMNEMRMPSPHFQDPRPPLLPFHPPAERGPFNQFFPPDMPFEPKSPPFHMRGPGMPNFRPRGMEPMYHDRFPPPPPHFTSQMPPMRHMGENMPRFQKPRFQQQNKQRFPSNNRINSNPRPVKEPQTPEAKKPVSAPSQDPSNKKSGEIGERGKEGKPAAKVCLTKNLTDEKDIPKTQSVSIENLSSSTSEIQLRKLCSSVGVVENFQLLKSERKAVIKFKEPRQALNFQKKYQRYMLDLAMIQVSLLST